MEPAEARARARDLAALWSVEQVDAADLVAAACDLLVTDHDGTALAMLAGVSARHADQEVPDLLEAALADVGLPYYEPGSAEGVQAALTVLAARVVAGEMEPSALTVWAHRVLGHDWSGPGARLVVLDDVYDAEEYDGPPPVEIDAEVLAEARRLVDGSRFVWRLTKYDPADRDEQGRYLGTADIDSDRGPVEAAYLASVAAFAAETGVESLAIREPSAPMDADIHHDGVEVSVDRALELVRSMLRGERGFCRLEAGDDFFVHVGWDQYVYVGSRIDCPRSVVFAEDHGLFAEPIPDSPYAFGELDDEDTPVRPADEMFWAELQRLTQARGGVLLEEGYIVNRSRWHRLAPETVRAVRGRLAPRARLLVWPDLTADVAAVLRSLRADDSVELVWQDRNGRIRSHLTGEDDRITPAERLANAGAATAISILTDERHPLMTAVLPDPDGVLRARWHP
ncbi:hypothetical protein [Paractinoplanes durhamensis]|uniref:hypothetical protein n=1 Tax=Paractinoplanes durhamensis TaxID=113563 RepID=UPI00194570CD|nr:hypothetical protein [Actinoplanes durhamensis]